MKAIIQLFPVAGFPAATRTKRVYVPALSTHFHSATDHPATGHTPPSRQQYLILLALACIYPMMVLVGCWVLFEVVQHFLAGYFAQIDSVTLHGPR